MRAHKEAREIGATRVLWLEVREDVSQIAGFMTGEATRRADLPGFACFSKLRTLSANLKNGDQKRTTCIGSPGWALFGVSWRLLPAHLVEVFDGVPQLRHQGLHAPCNVVALALGVLQDLLQVRAPLRVRLCSGRRNSLETAGPVKLPAYLQRRCKRLLILTRFDGAQGELPQGGKRRIVASYGARCHKYANESPLRSCPAAKP